MEFAGVLPEDAPDPRLERLEQLKAMPIPVVGFVEQRSLGVADISIGSGTDGAGLLKMEASFSPTLWRNPDDRSDPVNLAELDDATRRALEDVPPWPRPRWLIEQVERMRYPILWEAVRTTWNRDENELTTLEHHLVHHTNHVLMNRFREELSLGLHDWDSPALTSERAVQQGAEIIIDDHVVAGAMIDTDPFVYAIGAKLCNGGTLTVVIPRDDLQYIDLKFSTASPLD